MASRIDFKTPTSVRFGFKHPYPTHPQKNGSEAVLSVF